MDVRPPECWKFDNTWDAPTSDVEVDDVHFIPLLV